MSHLKLATEKPALRVLLVEDDPIAANIWMGILQSLYSALHVEWVSTVSAAEGMLYDSAEPFQLIVSDVFLSGDQTGVDFWKDHLGKKIPVLMTSGVPARDIEKLYGNHEMRPYFLPKPIRPSIAASVVKMLVGKRAA
jgi:response regulator of citrate/malate metabolism